MLLRLLAKMALFMFAFPALGLVAFHGSWVTALVAALLVGVAGVVATIALLPALATGGVLAELASAVIAGPVGAFLMGWLIWSIVGAVAIWLTALVVPGIILLGFWPTVGAAALLGVVEELLS